MSNIQALITKTKDDIELLTQHANQIRQQMIELESQHKSLVERAGQLNVRLHTLEEVAQMDVSEVEEASEFLKVAHGLDQVPVIQDEPTKPQTSEVRTAAPTHHHVGHRKNRHK